MEVVTAVWGLESAYGSFRGDVPTAAILAQALLAVVVIVVSDLESLLGYLGLTLSVSAATTVVASSGAATTGIVACSDSAATRRTTAAR